jgi:hypothetical protein
MRREGDRIIFSQTEISTFLRCESKHKYGYGLGLEIAAGHGSNGAMQFGTACHYAFEQAYNAHNGIERAGWIRTAADALAALRAKGSYTYKGVEQPLDKLNDNDWERAAAVVTGYYDNCLLTNVYDDLAAKYEYAAEVTGQTQISDDLYLEHTFDLTQLNAGGGPPRVFDHKFRGRVSADELVHLAPQNMMYSWAAWRMYGEPCNLVINTVQSKPPLYKTGRKSVTDYYRRDEFFHSEQQLETFGGIIRTAAMQIKLRTGAFEKFGNEHVRRTIISNGSDACTFCSFKGVCEQELDGLLSRAELQTILAGDDEQVAELVDA